MISVILCLPLYLLHTSQVLDWLLSLREDLKINTNHLQQALIIQGDVNVSFMKGHCQSFQV